MFTKIITPFIAAASLFAAPALAETADSAPAAAGEGAKAQPVELTQADVDLGVRLFGAVNAALATDSVPESVKTDMFLCVYNNRFGALSRAVGEVVDDNEALSRDVVNDLVNAMIVVCQIPVPEEAAEAATDAQR